MDYQALPPADLSMLASPDALVAALLDGARRARAGEPSRGSPAARRRRPNARRRDMIDGRLSVARRLARVTTETLAPHNPSYIRLPLGWPGECCRFAHPLDYIGFDGGGGIGSGPGMAVGAALALRGSDRLPVAVLGDGDYLMGLTALWTGVHYRIPLLIIVANNESFFNDELHQERVARLRGRPVENRWIGLRMSDPPIDLATLARGQGASGLRSRCAASPRSRPRSTKAVRRDPRRRGLRDRRARRAGILARRVVVAAAPHPVRDLRGAPAGRSPAIRRETTAVLSARGRDGADKEETLCRTVATPAARSPR